MAQAVYKKHIKESNFKSNFVKRILFELSSSGQTICRQLLRDLRVVAYHCARIFQHDLGLLLFPILGRKLNPASETWLS